MSSDDQFEKAFSALTQTLTDHRAIRVKSEIELDGPKRNRLVTLFLTLRDGKVPDNFSEEQRNELYDFLPDTALRNRLAYHVRPSIMRCEVDVEFDEEPSFAGFVGMTVEVPETLLDSTISKEAALKDIATRTSEVYNDRAVGYLFNPTHWSHGPSLLDLNELLKACSEDERLGENVWSKSNRIPVGTKSEAWSAQVEFERATLTTESIRLKTEETTKQLNDRLSAEEETRKDIPSIKTEIREDVMKRLRENFSKAWTSEGFDQESWETTFDIIPVIIDRDVKEPEDLGALPVHEDLVTFRAVPSDITLEQVRPKPYGSE